jgi:hypothetical protein
MTNRIMALLLLMLSSAAIAGDLAQEKRLVLGIECVRWSADASNIYCGQHPWKRNETPELTFTSVKEMYEKGFRVVAMLDIAGAYGRTVFVIEKQ